jgi:hypothetical protein
MYRERNIVAHWGNQFLPWKSNEYYMLGLCTLTHVTGHANRIFLRRVLAYCQFEPVLTYHTLFTLSHKRHDFRKRVMERKFCPKLSRSKKKSVQYYREFT